MNFSKWNLKEFISKLNETSRELDIGDNIAISYEESNYPIKINGVVREELKKFKGSFCIYYEKEKELKDYDINVEIISLEEYSDSPYSIYIDESGFVDADEYGVIQTIEIGDEIIFRVEDGVVTHYQVKELADD